VDNKFTIGELVMVTFYAKDVIGVAGDYDEEKDLLWVDLKLMDSSPNNIVYTGFKLSECRKITESEAFKHKLQQREVGAYGN
jgi:hypothetical protein